MRSSDWSSDVCSSDLERAADVVEQRGAGGDRGSGHGGLAGVDGDLHALGGQCLDDRDDAAELLLITDRCSAGPRGLAAHVDPVGTFGGELARSEEHTSELQSPMRTSYAVFCLK